MNKEYPQSFGQEEICELIPHRAPLLLVDGVDSWGEHFLKAHKNIDVKDPIFQGHFPSQPLYPGVYIVEGMAQAAAILLYLTDCQNWTQGIYYLASLSDVKFRRSVYPGDILQYHIDFKKKHGRFVQVEGRATVNDKEVCSAIITSAQGKEM